MKVSVTQPARARKNSRRKKTRGASVVSGRDPAGAKPKGPASKGPTHRATSSQNLPELTLKPFPAKGRQAAATLKATHLRAATTRAAARSTSGALSVSARARIMATLSTGALARVFVIVAGPATQALARSRVDFDSASKELATCFRTDRTAAKEHPRTPLKTRMESLAGTTALARGRGPEMLHSGSFSSTNPPPEGLQVHSYPNLRILLGSVDQIGLLELASSKRVRRIEQAPDLSLIHPTAPKAQGLPVGPTWGLRALGVSALWDRGFRGRNVVIGHLDTGVDGTHPALQGAVSSFLRTTPSGGRIPNAVAVDSGWHGTHTAGTLVGRPIGSFQIGVAPEATLASAMVIEGGDTTARILTGLDWLIEQGARIVNMSLGLPGGYREELLPMFQQLRDLDVLPVVAIGNSGPDTSKSPGNYVESLSVGAINRELRPDPGSSFQRLGRRMAPDVLAPGVDVESCVPGNEYASSAGTSMAAPHIAGLAALLLQAAMEVGKGRRPVSMETIQKALLGSASHGGLDVQRSSRLGIPNAGRALARLERLLKPRANGRRNRPRS